MPPLTGSIKDPGYVSLPLTLTNFSLPLTLILSTHTNSSFARCSKRSDDSALRCREDCDNGRLESRSSLVFHDGSQRVVATASWVAVSRGRLGFENAWRSGVPIGCADLLMGDVGQLGEEVDGIWGVAPGGAHPDYLTLCFGTGRKPGRVVGELERDFGSKAGWLKFVGEFVVKESRECPVRFVSPDSYDEDYDDYDEISTEAGMGVATRLDSATTYSWLPKGCFDFARKSLISACESLECLGVRAYADSASLGCFRFEDDLQVGSLPDLEWRLSEDLKILVPPSRYLFTTQDGSKCVGMFPLLKPTIINPAVPPLVLNTAVFGLNMLTGLRLRIDYPQWRLKIDSCLSKDLLPFVEDPVGGDNADDSASGILTFFSSSGNMVRSIVMGTFVIGLALGLVVAVVLFRRRWTNRRNNTATTIPRGASSPSGKNFFRTMNNRSSKVSFSTDDDEAGEEELQRQPVLLGKNEPNMVPRFLRVPIAVTSRKYGNSDEKQSLKDDVQLSPSSSPPPSTRAAAIDDDQDEHDVETPVDDNPSVALV